MKTRSILLSAILMAVITPAFAQATSGTQGTKMNPNMQSMPMHQNGADMKMMMNCMHVSRGMQDSSGMQVMPCPNQTAHGTGVIGAIDTAKGTVTIQHQAIASINWPAMTMTFRVDPPSLLKNVKVGEKVNFTLHPAGMNSTVTAITQAR